MDSQRYTTIARLFHWTIALMVAGQFALGWWMQSIPKSPPGGLLVAALALHFAGAVHRSMATSASVFGRMGWKRG